MKNQWGGRIIRSLTKKTSQPGHQNPQVSAKATGDEPSTTSGASGKSTSGRNVNADIIQTDLDVDVDTDGSDDDDNSESSSDRTDLNADNTINPDITDKTKNNS